MLYFRSYYRDFVRRHLLNEKELDGLTEREYIEFVKDGWYVL